MADASFIPSKESIESSRLFKALSALNALRASEGITPLETYRDLYAWSVEAPEEFWRWALHSLELSCEGQEDPVIDASATTLGARFFPNLKLNFTDNLLKHGAPDQTAIIALSEARGLTTRTYKELSDEVDAPLLPPCHRYPTGRPCRRQHPTVLKRWSAYLHAPQSGRSSRLRPLSLAWTHWKRASAKWSRA